MTGNAQQIIQWLFSQDRRKIFDIKEHREKRSRNANSYLWALIGEIADVFNTGSNDIYDVKREGKKNLLIPVIDDVVKEIDLENNRVKVYMMEGLDDEI